MIAFDPNTWLMYEGLSNHGHGLTPVPLVSVATFVQAEEDWRRLPSTGAFNVAEQVFREDYFDPVSRIRRGRFYARGGNQQPDMWWVHKHPLMPEEPGTKTQEGRVAKALISFRPMTSVSERLLTTPRTLVVLGAQAAITVWNIVSVERAGNNEDVVTLRARSNLGFLPDLLPDQIPLRGRERVGAAVTKVVDGAHRSSGVTVVDLCRNALVVVLSVYLQSEAEVDPTVAVQDLGKLITALPLDAKLLRGAADIARLLHPRGKSNEQQRYGTRELSESDGTFAIEALGFVLRDLGWAR